MKIEIPIKPFRDALGFIGNVVNKTNLPILNNVLVKANGKTVTLTASNLEITNSCVVELQQEGLELNTTIPLKKLSEIFRQATHEYAVLKEKEDSVEIFIGKSRFKLKTLPSTDYPAALSFSDAKEFTIESTLLHGMINEVKHAMAVSDVRYYLNGMLLEIENNKLTLVATDGHRLAKTSTEVEYGGEIKFIIPAGGVIELSKVLQNIDRDIEIKYTESHLHLDLADKKITINLIQGQYPDYKRILETNHLYSLTVGKSDLLGALQRAQIVTNPKLHVVGLVIGRDTLIVAANSVQGEESEEEIESASNHDNMRIGINNNYLIDTLSTLKKNHASISFSNAESSIKISEANTEFVVMPCRV